MALTSTMLIAAGAARITLAGELDAASAQEFRAQIEAAAAARVGRLVLLMHELTYMSSAGLRALAFARQKMGGDVDIYMVGVDEAIRETLVMTGFQHSVIMLDSDDEALG
jgi:anti-anti-sigma factor